MYTKKSKVLTDPSKKQTQPAKAHEVTFGHLYFSKKLTPPKTDNTWMKDTRNFWYSESYDRL